MAFISYLGNSLLYAISLLLMGLFSWIIIAFLFQLVSNSLRKSLAGIFGQKGYIYLTAPGVAVHELSHAFFCPIFRHKITKLVLFSPEEDGTLGYVNHTYDPKSYYQRAGNFFIGTGPVWGGIFILFLLSKLLLPAEMLPFSDSHTDNFFAFLRGLLSAKLWKSWTFYLWLYIALTVGSHITLSKPDLTGAKDGLLMLCGAVLFCCLVLGWCGPWEETVIGALKDFFFAQTALTGTIFCVLIIIAVILKLIPKKTE